MLQENYTTTAAFNESVTMTKENLGEYILGAKDTRIWGSWEVIQEPNRHEGHVIKCDKEIIVLPYNALSLQKHDKRGEIWTVVEGTLTAVIDDKKHILNKGDSIVIPLGAIHCMANMTKGKVVVHETQTGICEEADNIRIMDANGRATVDIDHPHIDAAKKLYAGIMADLTAVECNIKKVR